MTEDERGYPLRTMQLPPDMLTMADMEAVFSVTDAFGISREALSVPLDKVDPGSITKARNGLLEIVVPLTVPLEIFAETLHRRLLEMGHKEVS